MAPYSSDPLVNNRDLSLEEAAIGNTCSLINKSIELEIGGEAIRGIFDSNTDKDVQEDLSNW